MLCCGFLRCERGVPVLWNAASAVGISVMRRFQPSATPEGGEKQHVCGVRWRRSRAIRVSSKLLLVALSL